MKNGILKITSSIAMILMFATSCGHKADNQTVLSDVSSFDIINDKISSVVGASNYEIKVPPIKSFLENYFSDRDFETTYANYFMINLKDNTSITDSKNVTVNENVITINAEGTYMLNGNLSNGQIIINCEKTEKVHLILNNISIVNENQPALIVSQADKVFVTTTRDSYNVLKATITDLEAAEDAVIFSREDITFNGDGRLTLIGENANGITSKDEIRITSGTYFIDVSNHGLEANDYIKIANGEFYINAKKDGMNSDESEDETLGNIYIYDGDFVIQCENDAIDANGYIFVENGNFNIKANKDGFKANKNLSINDGVFEIDVYDDAIHSELNVSIYNGDFNIIRCNEGIEGFSVNINGGNYFIDSKKDAINLLNSEDDYEILEEWDLNAQPLYVETEGQKQSVEITAGNFVINGGLFSDGIDSGADLLVSGGNIIMSTNKVFYDGVYHGNDIEIKNGTIFKTGVSKNMFDEFVNYKTEDKSSRQCVIMAFFDFMQYDEITLINEDREVIAKWLPDKEFQSVLVSVPNIKPNQTYYLKTKTEEIEVFMDAYFVLAE